jgi:alpha-tubulin suppressor-like RCC1 family protein
MTISSGYKFPILDSSGNPTSTVVDMADMFVRKELFLDAGFWSCGYATKGLLGDGTTVNKSSPVQIGSLTNWKQIASGQTLTAAVKTDGTLWACGYNGYGQIGNNAAPSASVFYSSPIQVGSLTNWKQIAVGYYHTAAIKTDGTLWTWGNNTNAQLGDGTIVPKSSPIQVGSSTNWKQVAAGSAHTAAIKTDGTLWTWGYNNHGQIGNGATISTTVFMSTPVQVGSLSTWKQVSCGITYTIAIQTNGTLWACGYNDYGQIGNGQAVSTTVFYSTPIQVGSLTNWKQISAGYSFVAAIKTDGTLWTWGQNNQFNITFYGNLGLGDTAHRSSPVQVGSLTNWKYVSAGANCTAAIKTDGTLWTFGANDYGQLGSGTISPRSSPVQVGSLTNWKQVAGAFVTAAISSPDLP